MHRAAVCDRIKQFSSLVKFSHSVFAMPFALVMVIVTSSAYSVSALQLLCLVLCVVSARTAAMSFNRLIDARIDNENPRTVNREIPAGKVSKVEAGVLTALASLVFVIGAGVLGFHCLVLAFPVLAVLLGYSFLKRFTFLCHLILGFSLALAPGGAWYALTATWSLKPLSLMLAVVTWVSGFDILYSCQDIDFDVRENLHSIPVKLGESKSIVAAACLHAMSVVLLVFFGVQFELGIIYYFGVCAFGVFVASQYFTISKYGIKCVDQVFFTRNGLASLLLLLAVGVDRLIR